MGTELVVMEPREAMARGDAHVVIALGTHILIFLQVVAIEHRFTARAFLP